MKNLNKHTPWIDSDDGRRIFAILRTQILEMMRKTNAGQAGALLRGTKIAETFSSDDGYAILARMVEKGDIVSLNVGTHPCNEVYLV